MDRYNDSYVEYKPALGSIVEAAKHIGRGLCWLGFWIGLGLYNFNGCSAKEVTKIYGAQFEKGE